MIGMFKVLLTTGWHGVLQKNKCCFFHWC